MAARGGGGEETADYAGLPGGHPELPSPFRSGVEDLIPDAASLPKFASPALDGLDSFVRDLPERMEFAQAEEEVLKHWDEIKAFEKQLFYSKDKPAYTFYDGPPFATGLPHYGHILAGTIKDTVTRYAAQTGHFVSRRFGWDCHGLPVEYEIDKTHGITGRDDVLEMGIGEYNKLCRGIVTRYTKEWEEVVTRLGRWIDFRHDYKTMDPWFMESVWWVFKQLWRKDLVYQGFKVMPFSTACATPLSNFEAGQNYKDTHDPAVVVSFPLVDDPSTSFIAWTTTPWTLPSNLGLCVHPELEYVKIKVLKTGAQYILARSRLVQLFPKMAKKGYKGGDFEELESFPGASLEGKKYQPLFDYFVPSFGETAFRVLVDKYVTDDAGTGVVHQAPAFGEDDYRVCTSHGVIRKDGELPCPVDFNGRFTEEVRDFKGVHVKEADEAICKALKSAGRLVQKNSIEHSYPFCWRSDTPLIYRAVPSWFVRVEKFRGRIAECNTKTSWVPPAVKEGRFQNWLLDARDWAVSRNRFWGTPLPIWVSEDGEEKVCIGSIEELERRSGVKGIRDLHRDTVDGITIPSEKGKGVLRRVDEVFDCWFESGSMPYAQMHYPFEEPTAAPELPTATADHTTDVGTSDEFLKHRFPADFIAEGLDQTRGWFYTLMVLSTALFDKPAFQNLIVNGLVLAADGKKMSKRLQNYPDPSKVIGRLGADSLRLYLIRSPVVRGETLPFTEGGVVEVIKNVMNPWYNSFRFLAIAALLYEERTGSKFEPSLPAAHGSRNDLDRWILAASHGLVQYVHDEMKLYHLYTVVPRLCGFAELLTNWYIKLNRARMQGKVDESGGSGGAGEGGEDHVDDQFVSLSVLYEAVSLVTSVMAPFAPFFSEWVYQRLRALHPRRHAADGKVDEFGYAESIHHVQMPTADASLLDPVLEDRVGLMRNVIASARAARDKVNYALRFPSRRLLLVHRSKEVLESARFLERFICSETNCETVEYSTNVTDWCTTELVPDGKKLGKKLGKALRGVTAALAAMSNEEAAAFVEAGGGEVEGVTLSVDELLVRREFSSPSGEGKWTAMTSPIVMGGDHAGVILVAVDCEVDDALLGRGIARTITAQVQRLRKSAGLLHTDRVLPVITPRLRSPTETALKALRAAAKVTASLPPDATLPPSSSGSGGKSAKKSDRPSGPGTGAAAAAAAAKETSEAEEPVDPSKLSKKDRKRLAKMAAKKERDKKKAAEAGGSGKDGEGGGKKGGDDVELTSLLAGRSNEDILAFIANALGESAEEFARATGDIALTSVPSLLSHGAVTIASETMDIQGDVVVQIDLVRRKVLFPADDTNVFRELATSSLRAAGKDASDDAVNALAKAIIRTVANFDPNELQERLSIVVDEVPVVVLRNTHFFTSPQDQLTHCASVREEWVKAGFGTLAKAITEFPK